MFITPMPPPKSMNVLPSTSVSRAPFASSANIGVAMPTPEVTALCRRSINARLFGPGISVLILAESSILATSSCLPNSFQYTCRDGRALRRADAPEGDVLGVEVLLDPLVTALAPDARLLQAAERGLGRRGHPVVGPDDTVLEPFGEPEDPPDVARK